MRIRSLTGFTLAEAIVSIVLLGLACGLIAGALAAQQRGAREAAELRAARSDLRDAAAILVRELRGVSVRGDTLRLATDTAVEFFGLIAAGVACAPGAGGRLHLAAPRARGGGALTAAVANPDTGDVAWVWTTESTGESGAWVRHRIHSHIETTQHGCDPGFAAAGVSVPQLTLSGDLSGVPAGSPVHIVRRSRYSIYRASDGSWYLGFKRCNALGASACGIVQPVAGPYRVRAGSAAGIHFRWFDENDAALNGTTGLTRAARAEITIRSDTVNSARRVPSTRGLDDSLRIVVAFRNAW